MQIVKQVNNSVYSLSRTVIEKVFALASSIAQVARQVFSIKNFPSIKSLSKVSVQPSAPTLLVAGAVSLVAYYVLSGMSNKTNESPSETPLTNTEAESKNAEKKDSVEVPEKTKKIDSDPEQLRNQEIYTFSNPDEPLFKDQNPTKTLEQTSVKDSLLETSPLENDAVTEGELLGDEKGITKEEIALETQTEKEGPSDCEHPCAPNTETVVRDIPQDKVKREIAFQTQFPQFAPLKLAPHSSIQPKPQAMNASIHKKTLTGLNISKDQTKSEALDQSSSEVNRRQDLAVLMRTGNRAKQNETQPGGSDTALPFQEKNVVNFSGAEITPLHSVSQEQLRPEPGEFFTPPREGDERGQSIPYSNHASPSPSQQRLVLDQRPQFQELSPNPSRP